MSCAVQKKGTIIIIAVNFLIFKYSNIIKPRVTMKKLNKQIHAEKIKYVEYTNMNY